MITDEGGAMGTGFTTCTNGTCEAGTSLASGVRSRPYTADLANAYFVNTTTGGGGLLTCPLSTDECAPFTITPGDWGTTTAMATYDGELFWVEGRRLDYDESRIYHCDPADCSTPTLLINGLDYPRELAVDADGSYWIPNGSSTIQHCAPDHCAGGAQDLVTGLSVPTWLRTDDGFVYWLDGDHIWRVAK